MTLNEMRDKCHAAARSKGWYDQGQRNTGEALMMVVTELAEAMEEYRCGHVRWWGDDDGKPVGPDIEIADTLIRLFDFAGAMGIDLDEVVRVKMLYNEQRTHRHGGKLA